MIQGESIQFEMSAFRSQSWYQSLRILFSVHARANWEETILRNTQAILCNITTAMHSLTLCNRELSM